MLLSGFSDPGRATEYGVPFGGDCASSSARTRCAGLDEKKTIVNRENAGKLTNEAFGQIYANDGGLLNAKKS